MFVNYPLGVCPVGEVCRRRETAGLGQQRGKFGVSAHRRPLVCGGSSADHVEPGAVSRLRTALGSQPNGHVGTTVRLNVEFVTAANEAYQAHAAVTRPGLTAGLRDVHSHRAGGERADRSSTNVTVSVTNTAATAPVIRRLAITM